MANSALDEKWCGTRFQFDLSSVFMAVGVPTHHSAATHLLANLQEDEGMLREILENLGRSRSA